jgi:hypothetical protein
MGGEQVAGVERGGHLRQGGADAGKPSLGRLTGGDAARHGELVGVEQCADAVIVTDAKRTASPALTMLTNC